MFDCLLSILFCDPVLLFCLFTKTLCIWQPREHFYITIRQPACFLANFEKFIFTFSWHPFGQLCRPIIWCFFLISCQFLPKEQRYSLPYSAGVTGLELVEVPTDALHFGLIIESLFIYPLASSLEVFLCAKWVPFVFRGCMLARVVLRLTDALSWRMSSRSSRKTFVNQHSRFVHKATDIRAFFLGFWVISWLWARSDRFRSYRKLLTDRYPAAGIEDISSLPKVPFCLLKGKDKTTRLNVAMSFTIQNLCITLFNGLGSPACHSIIW